MDCGKCHVSDAGPRTLRCERCGVAFECDPRGACWCANVPVPPEALVQIRQKYADCLCPACLKAVGSALADGIAAAAPKSLDTPKDSVR